MLSVAEQRLGRKGTLVRLETLDTDAAVFAPRLRYTLVTMRSGL